MSPSQILRRNMNVSARILSYVLFMDPNNKSKIENYSPIEGALSLDAVNQWNERMNYCTSHVGNGKTLTVHLQYFSLKLQSQFDWFVDIDKGLDGSTTAETPQDQIRSKKEGYVIVVGIITA